MQMSILAAITDKVPTLERLPVFGGPPRVIPQPSLNPVEILKDYMEVED